MVNLQLLNKFNFFALIISYFFFSYLKIFYIIPYHIFFLSIGIIINLNKINYVINFLDKRMFLFFLILFIIIFKSYIYYPSETLINYFIDNIIINLAIIFYIISFVRTEKDIFFFEKTIIFISSVSMIVAIFQFLNFDLAWKLREFIDTSANNDEIVKTQISERKRPGGLAYYSITYSYQMLIIASLFFANYFLNNKKKNIIYMMFGSFGLIASLTRSSISGFIFATLFFYFFKYLNFRKFLSYSLLLLIFILIFMSQSTRDFLSQEDFNRYYLFLSGLNVFWDYFFTGVGGRVINDLTAEYAINFGMNLSVINLSIHNSILSQLIRHGFLMFIPIIYLYYIFFSNLKLLKYENPRLYVFFYIYIISYTFHSFFHNAGIFNGDQLFWIIFSYLFAVRNVYKINNYKKKNN